MSVARKRVWTALVAVVCAVGLLAGAGSALARVGVEKTFSYTGAEQKFKVPVGVTNIEVVAIGSEGGSSSGAGGVGAVVSGDLTVKPEQKLYVEVGGIPFNGGGATVKGGEGGGASDVRTTSIGAEPSPGSEASLKSRLLVAAGGGGSGASPLSPPFGNCPGGAGGAAAENGATGSNCGYHGGGGGGAGEAEKGGAAGGGWFEENGNGTWNGEAGRLGVGGTGARLGFEGLAGGGGGGLFGGGGGGNQGFTNFIGHLFGGAGGGGGGSNFVPPGGEASLASSGEASSVTITYTGPAFTIEKLQEVAGSGKGFTEEELTGKIGQTVDYQVIVKNAGTTPIKFSKLTDANCEGISPSGETELAEGASETFTCHHELTAAGKYANQATITGNEGAGEGKSNEVIVNVSKDATGTTVKCSPASFLLGQSTTCTATVKDEATSGAVAPTGTVAFKTSGEGSFSGEAKCTLEAPTTNSSSCSVTYKPSEATKEHERSDEISAEYEGDESHEKSEGPTTVTVLRHATLTQVKCSPASLVAGNSTTCTVLVEDTASSGGTAPTGTVALSTSGAGSFVGTCTLKPLSTVSETCSVTYKPTSTPTEPELTDTITAKYEGDEAHEGSKNTTTVAVISYSRTISGSVGGNLVVQAGQSVLLSSKARIEGNVTVKPGGALDVEGARIEGGINAIKSTRLRMCGASIEGSVMASNGTGKVVIGEGTTGCAGNAIEGNLTVTGNSAGVRVVGNTVNGNLMVTTNAGGATVTHNKVSGNLTVTGNTGTVVDKPNTVEGTSTLQ